jgi:chorismate mutase
MKSSETTTPKDAEGSLVALAARRLALGDKVAAAKYGSAAPIKDGGREEQLLADVIALSREMGLDPEFGARFFRAQIEANKVVQRRLHDLWSAHPDLRPQRKPNLESEVRPQLDAITKLMLVRLKAFDIGRDTAVRDVGALSQSLDDLHAEALRIALAPIHERMVGHAPDEA